MPEVKSTTVESDWLISPAPFLCQRGGRPRGDVAPVEDDGVEVIEEGGAQEDRIHHRRAAGGAELWQRERTEPRGERHRGRGDVLCGLLDIHREEPDIEAGDGGVRALADALHSNGRWACSQGWLASLGVARLARQAAESL